jgi:hypothetical protein
MDVGELALEKLLVGIPQLVTHDEALPSGYDVGVLAAWREAAKVFGHGVDSVEFSLRTSAQSVDVEYNPTVYHRVVERIQGPVRNRRTVEGRLLMADFKDSRPRCRVHPPLGPPVDCIFDEDLAESIYDNLRAYVSVTGEAEEDPETGRVRRLRIADVEPVSVEPEFAAGGVDDFWTEKTLEELSSEQGIEGPQSLAGLIGAGADLPDDEVASARNIVTLGGWFSKVALRPVVSES